jgi:replicative DNA helicase
VAAPPDVGVSPSPTSYDRVPPHNLDAEISVLGSMVLSRDAIAEVCELVGPEDFYRGAHRTIYESIRDLYDRGEPADPVTLTDELDRRGMLSDIGGAVAIADLVSRVPTAANALYYARIVAEHAVRRRLIDAGTQITRLGYQAEGADEAVDSAEALVYQVAQRNRGREFVSMKQLLTASFELIERLHDNNSAITGLSTGFVDFDECTAGLQPANLVILAARPAMGKCVTGATTVINPETGALQRIGEMVAAGDTMSLCVVCMGPDRRLHARQPTGLYDNGVQPVVRLRTRLGREIVATATHPFLTIEGWTPLAFLRSGTRIAAPRRLPFFGVQELSDAEIVRVADSLNQDAGAGTFVPAAFFCLPRRQVALFLSRLFACARHVEIDKRQTQITYTAASKRLAQELQHLLLRFGIIAEICELEYAACEGTSQTVLQIRITDPSSIEVVTRQIGILGQGGSGQGGADQEISGLTGTDLYWDEVVSMEPAGEDHVYDLEVPGDHNFVAADLIVHNSTLVTNIATHVAVNLRKPVVLFSLEMSQMELVLRILAGEARVDSERLRTGRLQESDWPKLSQAMGKLAEAPLFIDDAAGINLMEIRSKCRRLKQKHGLDLIVLDYLQLMQPSRRVDNRVQEVAELSRGLKILAKELDIPIIALSQLSRKPEDRSDRRPQLADLRDSGSIEQDADIVCFIYRDEVYDKESAAKGQAELIIAKHRNGPLRTIHLSFMGHYSRFADMARVPGPGNARPIAPPPGSAL